MISNKSGGAGHEDLRVTFTGGLGAPTTPTTRQIARIALLLRFMTRLALGQARSLDASV
jgi:hypothetical protein